MNQSHTNLSERNIQKTISSRSIFSTGIKTKPAYTSQALKSHGFSACLKISSTGGAKKEPLLLYF